MLDEFLLLSSVVELPDPLSQEEMIDYYKKYQDGDKLAKDTIVISNIKLVKFIVNTFFHSAHWDKEELEAIGTLGLVKAVDSYNPSHNIKFSSYCGVCIQNEIRMFLRKEKIKCKRCISIDDYVRTDDNENEVTGMDILCDINDDFVYDYEYKELCSLVRKYVYDLESPIKEAVIMSFGFDNQERLSQADIAKILNRDQSSVSRMIDKALMQISKKLILCGAIEDNKRNILNKSKKLK